MAIRTHRYNSISTGGAMKPTWAAGPPFNKIYPETPTIVAVAVCAMQHPPTEYLRVLCGAAAGPVTTTVRPTLRHTTHLPPKTRYRAHSSPGRQLGPATQYLVGRPLSSSSTLRPHGSSGRTPTVYVDRLHNHTREPPTPSDHVC